MTLNPVPTGKVRLNPLLAALVGAIEQTFSGRGESICLTMPGVRRIYTKDLKAAIESNIELELSDGRWAGVDALTKTNEAQSCCCCQLAKIVVDIRSASEVAR